jgi:hypothetical protein
LSSSDPTLLWSDAHRVSDYVAPDATGHQRSEERFDRTRYLQDRKQKLEVQLPTISGGDGVLSGVRVWIDGFLEGTTDIAMKAVVKKAGGDILYVAFYPFRHAPRADRRCGLGRRHRARLVYMAARLRAAASGSCRQTAAAGCLPDWQLLYATFGTQVSSSR